jgi:hypothetical protein
VRFAARGAQQRCNGRRGRLADVVTYGLGQTGWRVCLLQRAEVDGTQVYGDRSAMASDKWDFH